MRHTSGICSCLKKGVEMTGNDPIDSPELSIVDRRAFRDDRFEQVRSEPGCQHSHETSVTKLLSRKTGPWKCSGFGEPAWGSLAGLSGYPAATIELRTASGAESAFRGC